MAKIGVTGKELEILGNTPKGHLNSQEVFRLVLFARWGHRADYSKVKGNSTKDAEPEDIDAQWEDASVLMREAIGAGLLEPLVALDDSLNRVIRNQWPNTDEAWWQSLFVLARPVWPVPENLKFMEGRTPCFEVEHIRNWIPKLKRKGSATKAETAVVQPSIDMPIDDKKLEELYLIRMNDEAESGGIHSRTDDRQWAYGIGVTQRRMDDARRKFLLRAQQMPGRPKGNQI